MTIACGSKPMNVCYVCQDQHFSRDANLETTNKVDTLMGQGCFFERLTLNASPNLFKCRNENKWFVPVNAFLTDLDRKNLTLVSKDMAASVHSADLSSEKTIDSSPLRNKVSQEGVLTLEAKAFLLDLMKSPLDGDMQAWKKELKTIMDKMGYCMDSSSMIQMHTEIAEMLGTSTKPITSMQLNRYFACLISANFDEILPWICIRSLQSYLKAPGLDSEGIVTKTINTYLSNAANHWITPRPNAFQIQGQRIPFSEIEIDPRALFGPTRNPHSMLSQPNGKVGEIPKFLSDALFTRIQSIHDSTPGLCQVNMQGRSGSEIPHNFILPLAKRITIEGIYLYSNHAIDRDKLETPIYACTISSLSDSEIIAAHNKDLKRVSTQQL